MSKYINLDILAESLSKYKNKLYECFLSKQEAIDTYSTKEELNAMIENSYTPVSNLDIDCTDLQVPSAKAVYDKLDSITKKIEATVNLENNLRVILIEKGLNITDDMSFSQLIEMVKHL